jgi:hypothetical protein
LKRYKSPRIDQTPAEPIQAGGERERSNIINSVWNKEELPPQYEQYITEGFMRRIIKLITAIVKAYRCFQLRTKIHPTFFYQC